jgi:predicted unusual protein kinase regulating ubiquinone biosynthesis (AarF/ABC1/UbiB family)
VKLGQFVASSPTLFPPEYVTEFQRCLDQTSPMPWREVRLQIESELGRPLDRVFASVSQTPLAAASIAQVHAATLRTGEDVVIKVQKRGVQDSLRADLDLLYGVARVLQLVGLVTAELTDIVSTLREAILEETDFVKEAERTTQFREFLDRSPQLADSVTVPKVYPQASSRRVLTLERLYGVSLTDLEVVRKYQPEPELALITALNAWVLSVLTNKWFHADVHAGNLLVLHDGRVAFIDFGIVGSIPEKTAIAMVEFVRAFPEGDSVGIASALAGMGFVKEDEVDIPAFSRDLREVLQSLDDVTGEGKTAGAIDDTQLNRLVASVGKVAAGYGIRFPREFALLIKQVLYFDRFTRLLAPDLDVMNDERIAMNQPLRNTERGARLMPKNSSARRGGGGPIISGEANESNSSRAR